MIPPEVVCKMFGPCALCAPRRPLRLSAYSARVVRAEMLGAVSATFRERVQRRVSGCPAPLEIPASVRAEAEQQVREMSEPGYDAESHCKRGWL